MRNSDYTAAIGFLGFLFAGTDGPVELRAIRKLEDGGGAISNYTRDPETVVTFCRKHDKPGWGVYFGCANRTAGIAKGDREHCRELGVIPVDIDCVKLKIDFDEALSALLSLPKPPSCIVHSGRGLHAYWRLREPLDLSTPEHDEAIVAVLRQLIGVCCGDASACDIPRVMRLPGTLNTKDEPVLCKVLYQSDVIYDFDEIVDWLDWQRPVIVGEIGLRSESPTFSNPFLAAAERFGFKPPLDVEQALAAMRFEAPGENSIHQTQLRVSASMVRHGAEDDEIVAGLLAATRSAVGLAGEFWNWGREERAIRSMVATARVKFPPAERRARPADQQATSEPSGEPTSAEIVSIAEARTARQAKPKPEITASSPLITRLGEAVLAYWQENRPVLARIDGGLWCYARGWWKPFNDEAKEELRIVIQDMFRETGNNPTASATSAVLNYVTLHSGLTRAGSFGDCHHLVGHDNALDLDAGLMEPHNPDHLARHAIGCSFDVLALCPDWDRYLASTFSNHDNDELTSIIAFLQEWAGCLLMIPTKRELRKALVLFGASRTGKTQFAKVMRALLGDKTSGLRLKKLNDDQFAMYHLAFVRGWIGDDAIGPRDDLASEVFKQIVTGEHASIRMPGGKAFDHSFSIPVLLTANDLPKIKDLSDGVYNRMALMRLSVVMPEGSEGTEEIGDRIVRMELPGVINWALDGRRRALERARLVLPASVIAEVRTLKSDNNPMGDFIARCIIVDPEMCVDRRDVWAAFDGYHEEEEGEPAKAKYGRRNFYALFKRAAGCAYQDMKGGSRALAVGIRLSEYGIEMVEFIRKIAPMDKARHGSDASPQTINKTMGSYTKNASAQRDPMGRSTKF